MKCVCVYIYNTYIHIYESESDSVVSTSLWSHTLNSPWNSPGQNSEVCSISLFQGIFLTQVSNPKSPTPQVDSLPAEPQGKYVYIYTLWYIVEYIPVYQNKKELQVAITVFISATLHKLVFTTTFFHYLSALSNHLGWHGSLHGGVT